MFTLLFLACTTEAPAPAASTLQLPPPAPKTAAAPAKPKSAAEMTVVDVAVASPNHTTLVAAVKAAELVAALSSPGGIYTVFAPTDAAFAELPPGTVEGLLVPEKKQDLKLILQHHAMVPIVEQKDLKDGMELKMSDGNSIFVHREGDVIKVDEATILGEARAVNGVVYVVDKVILPKPK
jgi:uncharacterized surface protein with fasciclin (FAS1) repeats